VPPELDRIVQRMGHNHPHERYQTCDELLLDLYPWLPVTEWLALGITPPPPKVAGVNTKPAGSGSGFVRALKKLFGK